MMLLRQVYLELYVNNDLDALRLIGITLEIRKGNTKMDELFTVVILSYKNSQYLEGCLNSILRQAYPNIEIIIADDCSREFDADKFKTFCEKNSRDNIKNVCIIQNETNLGTVKNVNKAIRYSNGAFFKLIGADDELADANSLVEAAKYLKSSLHGIITSDVIKCDSEMKTLGMYSNRLQKYLNEMTAKECFVRLCIHNDIVAGGVFFTKNFIDTYGYFDERYKLLEDWPMWLRVTRAGAKIIYCPFNAIKYRSNVGYGTSVNQIYMRDKKDVFANEIEDYKKEIGALNYLKAKLMFAFINSLTVRKAYGMIKRRGSN